MKSFRCDCKINDKNNWRVIHSRGAYNPSKSSTVLCLKCGSFGRTKVKCVNDLEVEL